MLLTKEIAAEKMLETKGVVDRKKKSLISCCNDTAPEPRASLFSELFIFKNS
jgi:hypothetical protein